MLESLKKKYEGCNVCKLCLHTCKVYGYGNPNTDIMVVGEGPGRVECETGIPFTGPAGKLMDEIFSAIGLAREKLYFTNVVICRTNEKNRTPSWSEIQNCALRLDEEINIVKPSVIVMLGSPSLQRFFGKDSKVSITHGQWFMDLKPPFAKYFSLMHPSWVLHSNTEEELMAKKKTMWQDVKVLRRDLEILNFSFKEKK